MAKEFYLTFPAARYWMTATQTEKHAQKEFETRNEVKEWLIERACCSRLRTTTSSKPTAVEPFEFF